MNFQICTGIQERAGVTKQGDIILFSSHAAENAKCNLVLYPRDNGTVMKIPMKAVRPYWENFIYCGNTGAGLGEL